MNRFLKSKSLYMLSVLPFIVMAIAFFNGYITGTSLNMVPVRGLINLAFLNELSKTGVFVAGTVIVLCVAYTMFFVNQRFKFLSQRTTLPALIYVLLTSGLVVNIGFNYLLVSVFIVAVAQDRLQLAIVDSQRNHSLFDFGFLILLAVAIYPKFILLVPWALCAVLFSGRASMRDGVALLLGFVTPIVFIAFYYFWTDRLVELPRIFIDNLSVGGFPSNLSGMEIARLAMLVFLLIVALGGILNIYPVLMVNQRRAILSILLMLLFLVATIFVIPGNYYDFMYILAVPLSFIYAQYFITSKLVIFSNLMFFLLLSACFLTYLV